MATDIVRAINDAVLRRMAGDPAYQRGLDYFLHGHVESIADLPDGVEAVVRGTLNYDVSLAVDEGVLDYTCDCPVGSDGAFCKHCVAVALAWRRRLTDPTEQPDKRGKAKPLTLEAAAKILEAEDHMTLVRLLVGWAKEDRRLRERVLLYAARRAGPESAAAAVGRAFQKAVRIHGFIDYRAAGGWASEVHDAIDAIEQLLNDGHAAAVVELCEPALLALTEAAGNIDDSDGCLTELRDRLHDLHFRACQEARPDPVALAERFFAWDMADGELDVFYGAAQTYSEILGPQGLQAYRALAEAAWAKVPASTRGSEEMTGTSHFRISRAMEALARASGDVDELAQVMSRDLSHVYGYLRIAEVYREARQFDNALEWAEKGPKAFPVNTDYRLREFAADEYHRRGSHNEAIKLMWAAFIERPYLEGYQTLEKHAKRADAWPEWRDRALAEIRLRIAKAKAKGRRRVLTPWAIAEADHTVLAEIFLYEEDSEAAWREAQTGGCSDLLWLKLAVARDKDHPEESAPIYLKQAEAAIVNARNSSYTDAYTLLFRASKAMHAMERGAEFVRILDALRLKYKPKRNFIKLTDQKRNLLCPRSFAPRPRWIDDQWQKRANQHGPSAEWDLLENRHRRLWLQLALPRTSSTASRCRAMTASSTRVGASGRARPCSQLWRLPTESRTSPRTEIG